MIWGGGMLWSESTRAWCGFIESRPNHCLHLRHELTWIRVAPEDAAKDIVRKCKDWDLGTPIIYAQPALFPADKSRGETVSQTFQSFGVTLRKADDDTVNGWSRVRSWLRSRTSDGAPRFTVHEDCKYFRKTFPTLIQDPAHPDEVLDTPDANPASGLRFYLMARPSPFVTVEPDIPPDAIYWAVEEIRRANRDANRVE
jgi:hypothetical protein